MLFGLRSVSKAIYGVLGLAVLGFALVSGLAFAAGPAAARSYPTRPITLVVPFPPGGGNDGHVSMMFLSLLPVIGKSAAAHCVRLRSPPPRGRACS